MTRSIKQREPIDNSDIRELNRIGDRIKWCRLQLGLSQIDVSRNTGIKPASYNGRELGVRATISEEYDALSSYFNGLWRKKFKDAPPEFNGDKIKRITFSWLVLGRYE